MKHKWLLASLVVITVGLFAARVAFADSGTTSGAGASIVEQIGCDQTTTDKSGAITVNRACQITDFVNLFVYLSKWAMSILAMLATLMMVWGGFQFLTAGGRPSKVDEGRRIMLGTVVGTIVALTGYIIINSTFAAVTGTRINSNNPFGVVSSVFDNPQNRNIIIDGQTKPLIQPFTGVTPGSGGTGGTGGTGANVAACRKAGSGWDFSCTAGSLQVYCADPAAGGTPVVNIQTKLETKGCVCGGNDGCFGPNTVQCVRQFQIANSLPPTGVVDPTTQDRIDNGTIGCTPAAATLAAKLPETSLSTDTGTNSGCCVVNDGANDLYCVDNVSTRACGALGPNNTYVSGKCGLATKTVGRCGFCSNISAPTVSNGSKCFSFASPSWCSNNTAGGTSPTFQFGNCDGRCASCVHSLLPSF